MLTPSLLDDCRNFVIDILCRFRGTCDSSFISGIIELGGDAVSCLTECRESLSVAEKVRLISCSLNLFKKLLYRIELAETSGIISDRSIKKNCGKLISRLENCFHDYNHRAENAASRLPSSKVLLSTSRLTLKTPSESDIPLISAAVDQLFPLKAVQAYSRDYLREMIKRKDYGDIIVIARMGDLSTVGVAFMNVDFDDPDRLRADIMILPEHRCRGYFLEALDGIMPLRHKHGKHYVLSLYLPLDCEFLVKSCMRYGFKTEGAKESAAEKQGRIVMSKLA